jgi:DNA-damage-inducible protein J
MSKVKRKTVRAPSNRQRGMGGMIRARVGLELKRRAKRIFSELGLNSSEAIRLFYAQVILRKGLPFEASVPNATTRQAMTDADASVNLTRFRDADAMIRDLGR